MLAAQSAIETAFACLQSGEASDIAGIAQAVRSAIETIDLAESLQTFEAGAVATEALRLAEKLKPNLGSQLIEFGRICESDSLQPTLTFSHAWREVTVKNSPAIPGDIKGLPPTLLTGGMPESLKFEVNPFDPRIFQTFEETHKTS